LRKTYSASSKEEEKTAIRDKAVSKKKERDGKKAEAPPQNIRMNSLGAACVKKGKKQRTMSSAQLEARSSRKISEAGGGRGTSKEKVGGRRKEGDRESIPKNCTAKNVQKIA